MIKLLLFSDLHCDAAAARRLVQLADGVDAVIGAGDFANMRYGLSITIDILKAIDKPTLLVPGNGESTEELVAACVDWPSAQVLHGTGTTVAGVSFFGLGGGIPVTPFGAWSYDFTEAEAAELLKDCPDGGILISHSPPKGFVDLSSSGRHLGSTAVNHTIQQKQPKLVVCGHIHASAGRQAQLGNTMIVNAGPKGIVWEI